MLFVREGLRLLAVSLALARADPDGLVERHAPQVNCKKISHLVADCQNLGAAASSFCRAYLHLPQTTTKTVAATFTPTVTALTTTTITSTDFLCVPTPVKREIGMRGLAVPRVLRKYKAADISSACSCLHMHQVTATATQTALPVTVALATSTICTCDPDLTICSLDNPFACCGGQCIIDQDNPDTAVCNTSNSST